jgi:alcohol dehydrogenase class IV
MFLPYTIEYIGEAREELWAEIAYAIKLEVPEGKRAATVLAQAIRGLAREIGQPLSIKQTGISLDSFNKAMGKLVDNVMSDGSLIVSARIPNVAESEKFFHYTYEGKSIDF